MDRITLASKKNSPSGALLENILLLNVSSLEKVACIQLSMKSDCNSKKNYKNGSFNKEACKNTFNGLKPLYLNKLVCFENS